MITGRCPTETPATRCGIGAMSCVVKTGLSGVHGPVIEYVTVCASSKCCGRKQADSASLCIYGG